MGTFVIRPTDIVLGSISPLSDRPEAPDYIGWVVIGGTLSDVLNAVQNNLGDLEFSAVGNDFAFNQIFNAAARFQFNGDCIFLDGSPTPISFAGLPSGFNPTAASAFVTVDAHSAPSILGVGNYFLQHDAGSDGPENTSAFAYDFTPPFTPDMLTILGNGIGFKVNIERTAEEGATFVFNVYNLRIEGTYEIQTFTYDFPDDGEPVEPNTGPVPGPKVPNGKKVIITSDPDNPPALELDHITIDIGACGEVIITNQTKHLLIFYIPPDCQGEDIPVDAIGDGVQFSGTINLGSLDVLVTNGSGIYKLTPGKTNDTLYSSLRDGTTRDVKIPDPTGRTGLVGG